tara:strand:- start:150 stop:269 length:120 start_codon:yes stop_codon:yes gene_type:complete
VREKKKKNLLLLWVLQRGSEGRIEKEIANIRKVNYDKCD